MTITFTLQRTNQPPLIFEGVQVALADDDSKAKASARRWHTLALYRSTAGSYVLEILYACQWPGEPGVRTVVVLERGLAGLVPALQAYDPVKPVVGMAHFGEQFARKHGLIVDSVRRRWEAQVGAFLAQIPEAGETLREPGGAP